MKYINPGFSEDFGEDGITVRDAQRSKTGVCIQYPKESNKKLLPAFPERLYGRFDFYPELAEYFCSKIKLGECAIALRYEKPNGSIGRPSFWVQIESYYSDGNVRQIGFKWAEKYDAYDFADFSDAIKRELNIRVNEINTLHFSISPSEDWKGHKCVTIKVNGEEILDKVGTQDSYFTPNIGIYVENSYCMLSNIILSDELFSEKETIIGIPLKDDAALLLDPTGMYSLDSERQMVFQRADIEALGKRYGSSFKVCNIVQVACPAYRTGEGFSSLTMLEKVGDVVSQYAQGEVSTSKKGIVLLNRAVDTTLADVCTRQIGWKAGTS